MITEVAMEAFFDAIVLVLTPIQRFNAARSFPASDPDMVRFFITIGLVALATLTVLFLIVSCLRRLEWKKVSRQLFSEQTKKKGLSGRECQILLYIAKASGVKHNNSAIFTMSKEFDRVAARMMEEHLAQYGQEAADKLRTELSLLRDKLGFKTYSSASMGSTVKPSDMSSRRIPVGKQVSIRYLKKPEFGEIEATVVRNNNMEFTVQFSDSVEGAVGEKLCVRYCHGPTFWEFDTLLISLDGEHWVLNHSDDIRFINRRTFQRVLVNRPAFIAKFSFLDQFTTNFRINDEKDLSQIGRAHV
jgi:hypothetical protein